MKIFVTGASGFIGKQLVNKLVNDGHQVTVNVRKPIEGLPIEVKTFSIREDNINETIQFFKNKSFDGIIHLGSLYITVHKPEDVVTLINSNVRFSSFVLEAAAQAKINWFINTGTFWQNYQNNDYSPVNLYAATKQAFENVARYYIETEQIRFTTLRLSDTYGTNDTRLKFFNLWNRIVDSGEVLDMSAGEQLIDILYIDDILNAYSILALQLQNQNPVVPNGAVYAVKAEKRYSLKQLAEIFEKVTQTKLNINWGAKPYREREVMIPWENGNTVPGWNPQVCIEEGIKKLIGNN